jgi:hypothetical protein
MQPSNISAIFAKVEHINFEQITNHLSLPFLVFQPPFHPDVVAEFLSRPNQATTGSVATMSVADLVDFQEMATQRLAGDISTGKFRPIVPLKFRKSIFDHFHNVAHPGRLTSCRIISSRFVWRGLSNDVTSWAQGCLACQRGKIHRHTCLVPLSIPIPQRRFSHLHVDLVGPLNYSCQPSCSPPPSSGSVGAA